MPLTHDPELQEEIEKVIDTTILEDKAARKIRFIFLVLFLTAVFVCVEVLGLQTGTKVSVIIISCSLAIMWVLYDVMIILHSSSVLIMAAVEWVGRKQLGEYEPPQR